MDDEHDDAGSSGYVLQSPRLAVVVYDMWLHSNCTNLYVELLIMLITVVIFKHVSFI